MRFTRHVPAFLLCAVVVVYCTYHLLSSLWPKPVLEPAMLEEYESTAVFDGYILRAEELLVAPTVGEALPTCRDGEKVAAGQTVARVYASVNEDSYRALTDIRRRISILERAKTTYASLKDAPQIRALIERTVVEYNDAVRRNDLAAAQALQDTILAASAQYRALTEGYQSYAADIAALEAQSAALEAGLGAVLSSVSAPAGGCYYAAVDGLEIRVYPIVNRFFGETITVAGLLTAKDMIEQLGDKPLGDELLFPATCLRAEGDLFLDDQTPEDLSRALRVPVCAVESEASDLIRKLLGLHRQEDA